MSKKKITLVKPDDEQAGVALSRYERARRTDTSVPIVYMSLAIMLMVISDGVVVYIAAFFGAAFALLPAVAAVRSRRAGVAYRHHLQRGDLITVDRHLVEVWDELRTEENVPLSAAERDTRIGDLFYAARDLQGDLARRREIRKEPELQEELLLMEARIRARLLREVTALKHELEARQQLAALAPDAADDWATGEEIEEQVRFLRSRLSRSSSDAAGDPTAVVPDPRANENGS